MDLPLGFVVSQSTGTPHMRNVCRRSMVLLQSAARAKARRIAGLTHHLPARLSHSALLPAKLPPPRHRRKPPVMAAPSPAPSERPPLPSGIFFEYTVRLLAGFNLAHFPALPTLPHFSQEIVDRIFYHLPILDKLKLIWICKNLPDATDRWLLELPRAEKFTMFGNCAKPFHDILFHHPVFDNERSYALAARTPKSVFDSPSGRGRSAATRTSLLHVHTTRQDPAPTSPNQWPSAVLYDLHQHVRAGYWQFEGQKGGEEYD